MIDKLLPVLSISCFAMVMVACCVLLFTNKKQQLANRLLALSLLGLASVMLVFFLLKWNPGIYAHIYRLPSPLAYLIFPAAYLYTRKMTYNEKRLPGRELLHFLPAAIYLAGILPHFFTSYVQKLEKAKAIASQPGKLFELNEGFLPPYYNLGILCIQGFVYNILIIFLLRKASRIKKENSVKANASVNKWMSSFVVSTAIIALPLALLVMGPGHLFNSDARLLLVTVTLAFLVISLFLFFHPELLYGIRHKEITTPVLRTAEVDEGNTTVCTPVAVAGLQDDLKVAPEFSNLESYKPLLESYMRSARPFLKQGFGIYDLSRETGIPQHHLSALLNRVYKLRFTDYINGMRIEYIAENFGDGEWENLTLEGIAKQAGFTSRTTFFNAIKKTAGVSPSEFIAQLKRKSIPRDNCGVSQ